MVEKEESLGRRETRNDDDDDDSWPSETIKKEEVHITELLELFMYKVLDRFRNDIFSSAS